MLLNQQHQSQVSGLTPMPIDRIDDTSVIKTSTAETVVWYYSNSGVLAAAVGQVAGTVVMAKLGYSGVTNALGSALGSKNDTSLSFAAATRASTLVFVPEEAFSKMEGMTLANKVSYIATWLDTNGDYAIDHRRGVVWLKSLATVANDAATYKYQANSVSIETGDVQIGSVELKDADSAALANIKAANTARTTGTVVVAVQGVGADGTVAPTGSLNTNAPFSRLTDGTTNADVLTGGGLKTGVGATADDVGFSTVFDADGDNTAQAIKAGAGNLYALTAINTNVADAYIQLFDALVGDVTVGTTTPKYVFPVLGQAAYDGQFTVPMKFSTGISYACTTTPTGAGDPTVGLTIGAGYL